MPASLEVTFGLHSITGIGARSGRRFALLLGPRLHRSVVLFMIGLAFIVGLLQSRTLVFGQQQFMSASGHFQCQRDTLEKLPRQSRRNDYEKDAAYSGGRGTKQQTCPLASKRTWQASVRCDLRRWRARCTRDLAAGREIPRRAA